MLVSRKRCAVPGHYHQYLSLVSYKLELGTAVDDHQRASILWLVKENPRWVTSVHGGVPPGVIDTLSGSYIGLIHRAHT